MKRWAMKYTAAIFLIVTSSASIRGSEPHVVPPEPPIEEIAEKAHSAAIVLTCKPNKDQSGLEVFEVLKGSDVYIENESSIAKLIGPRDPKALATNGFLELIFIAQADGEGKLLSARSIALWPARHEKIGSHQVHFLAHDYSLVKRTIQEANKQARLGGPGQPATTPESKSEGKEEPKPESEGRNSMNNTEEISLIATGLAIVALVNWLTGDRSFRGRELLIRRGPLWIAFRWFGLGLWTATLVASGSGDFWLEIAGLAGASILLLGTARQARRARVKPDEREQSGAAGQPAARPLSK